MEVFDPVKLSLEENAFLLRHLGEPWITAQTDIHPVRLPNPHPKDKFPFNYPDGVTPAAVKPVIDRVYELNELTRHQGQKWVGVEAIKASINTYLEQSKRWEKNAKRGAPRYPSMSTFNQRGQATYGAAGSDCGQVKTYFDETGKRREFAIKFIPDGDPVWTPEWIAKVAAGDDVVTDGLRNNAEQNRVECLVCGHTESYKLESRSSYNAARARISKHLRSANTEVDRHREVHAQEFGSRR